MGALEHTGGSAKGDAISSDNLVEKILVVIELGATSSTHFLAVPLKQHRPVEAATGGSKNYWVPAPYGLREPQVVVQ